LPDVEQEFAEGLVVLMVAIVPQSNAKPKADRPVAFEYMGEIPPDFAFMR
jgi:hypothetical protein